MRDERPGVIRNREAAKRLRDYSGLRWGRITPTDIDAFLDFRNEVFVVIEAKRAGAKIPYGQRLALERLVTALSATKRALLLIVEHACEGDQDIDIGACTVSQYYSRGRWFIANGRRTTRRFIDAFLRWRTR